MLRDVEDGGRDAKDEKQHSEGTRSRRGGLAAGYDTAPPDRAAGHGHGRAGRAYYLTLSHSPRASTV